MANTFWCGYTGDKLYLQSGQFSSTLKTSLLIDGIDSVPHGISFDGTDTPWCGLEALKLYLQSGQFSSTLKTSFLVSGIDSTPAALSFDGADTPWAGRDADGTLYLQSGQFSSTLKTSLVVGTVETQSTGISFDGTDTPWCGAGDDKLYLQSGQFSSTLKNSLAVGAVDSTPIGISWDGTYTSWCGSEADKLYLQSGKFSSTLKTSLAVGTIDTQISGMENGDTSPRIGQLGAGPVNVSSNATGALTVTLVQQYNDADTKLLLHGDGVDESTTITDSSPSEHTITAVADAQIDTAQKVFGTGSILVDGTLDAATVPDHADWQFGTAPWTIDFRARWNGADTDPVIFVSRYKDAQNYCYLYKASGTDSGDFQLHWKVGNVVKASYKFTWDPAPDTDYHIAIVRDGTDVYIFIDGDSKTLTVNTAVSTNNLTFSGADLWIGAYESGPAYHFAGWIEEFRVSHVARWTTNFTPPQEAYGDEGGEIDFAGSLTAASNTTGSLEIDTPLAGSTTASSDVAGSLSVGTPARSVIIATSSVSGSLSVLTQLAGSVIATSSATASLTIPGVEIELSGSVTASSNVAGDMTVRWNLYASAEAVSSAVGSLNVDTSLLGEATAESNIAGSLEFTELRLQGAASAVSGATAFVNVLTTFAGSVSASSFSSGTVYDEATIPLGTATIAASSNVAASLSVGTQLAGSSIGASGTADFLILNAVKFKAVVSAVSSAAGYATCIWRLFGNIEAASSLITYTIDLYPDFEATTLFWRPQANIIETLEWKTDVLKSHDGTEQRIKVRQSPRQFFRYKILLDTDKLNTWMDSQVHGWLKLKWLVPIWTEFIEHTDDINYRDDSITVDTTEADFRAGGKAIIWKSRTEYEVVVIDTVRPEQLTLNKNYGVLSNFTGKKYIMPVREAYMTMSTNKERYNTEIATATMTFKIHDNTNLTGWIPSANYDGLPVLNAPTYMERTHAEGSNPNNKVLDYGTGTFEVVNHSDFNYTTQAHKFHNDTKAACWDFRKFLYSLNGKQKSILIPTFRSDFVQSGTIISGQTYVDIEKINLTSNMGLNSMRTYIGFYFPLTGQLIIRKITGIATVGIPFHATLERITFDADLGYSDVLSSGDCRIGFVDKCRLESDKVEIDWEWTDKNVCDTKFARVI